MPIIVTTDSSCDLSDTLLDLYKIETFPLTIIQDGTPFKDGLEIKPETIYQHVAGGGSLPSTSAVNLIDYQTRFAVLSQQYDAVIHISLGSGFSSCCFNAKLAAEEFSNVYVVDSQNLSSGQGQVVLEACRLAAEQQPVEEIAVQLQAFAAQIEFSFVLDQVTYLHRGGRCSNVAALGANLLHLKPVIDLRNGSLSVGKKYRGAFTKALQTYIKDQLAGRHDIDPERVLLVTTGCPDEWIELAHREIEQLTGVPAQSTATAGCTISSHCGPKTLGVAMIRRSFSAKDKA